MTTRDITESLRNLNTVLLVGGSDWSDILLDAALEIERLRAENNLLQAAQGMLKAERDALKEQVEAMVPICSECYALRADAQRYRWLKTERKGGWDDNVLYVPRLQYWIPLRELDAVIDAARGE